MKKAISLLLAFVLCLSLCACGKPSIESCVLNANTLVSRHEPYLEGCYKFSGEYLEEDNTYVIMMCVDDAKLDDMLADSNEDYTDLIRTIAINKLDSDTETISFELKAIQDSVEPLFEKTDVTVISGYVDSKGNVSRYN